MVPINRWLIIVVAIIAFNWSQAEKIHYVNVSVADSLDTGKVIILKSGFLSKDSTVIEYIKGSKKIIRVYDNGGEVPARKYGKYHKQILEMLEMERMSELLPELRELEVLIESEKLSSIEKLFEMEIMLKEMAVMKSELAEVNREIIGIRHETLSFKVLRKKLQETLWSNDVYPPDEVNIIEVDAEKFIVDGIELDSTMTKLCRDVYEDVRGNKVGKNESVKIQFD